MAERDEDFTEDLDAFVPPRPVGMLKVGGVLHTVQHYQSSTGLFYRFLEMLGNTAISVEDRDWALLKLVAPTLTDDLRGKVPGPALNRWVARAMKATASPPADGGGGGSPSPASSTSTASSTGPAATS